MPPPRVCQGVPFEVALLHETLPAILALELPLAGVCEKVLLHVSLLHKSGTAFLALEPALACVGQEVALEVPALYEALPTLLALVLPLPCVDQVVDIQVDFLYELLPALLTLESPLACVCQVVHLQVDLLHELLLALLALKLPLVVVCQMVCVQPSVEGVIHPTGLAHRFTLPSASAGVWGGRLLLLVRAGVDVRVLHPRRTIAGVRRMVLGDRHAFLLLRVDVQVSVWSGKIFLHLHITAAATLVHPGGGTSALPTVGCHQGQGGAVTGREHLRAYNSEKCQER